MEIFIFPALALVLLLAPLVGVLRGKIEGRKAKHRIIMNLCMFAGICILGIVFPLSGAFAAGEEAAEVVTSIAGTTAQGLGFIAAALSTGLACLGGGIAVAAAAPAAIGAVSENAKNFGKAIIFVVLGEGMAIYGLLISILIITNL
ncbi:MAG: ATP synthase subunit C [Oscillospiraceae bacterium]|nr:ATP synthase subunit C [Oscillospiraceae bacterium]